MSEAQYLLEQYHASGEEFLPEHVLCYKFSLGEQVRNPDGTRFGVVQRIETEGIDLFRYTIKWDDGEISDDPCLEFDPVKPKSAGVFAFDWPKPSTAKGTSFLEGPFWQALKSVDGVDLTVYASGLNGRKARAWVPFFDAERLTSAILALQHCAKVLNVLAMQDDQ